MSEALAHIHMGSMAGEVEPAPDDPSSSPSASTSSEEVGGDRHAERQQEPVSGAVHRQEDDDDDDEDNQGHHRDMANTQMKPELDENAPALAPPAAKPKYDPKDPHRPRRKKARRACFACQRAHLTCGDERPCQRCIKRGLADVCQDGVRKKAKYLHDAPSDALGTVLGPSFHQANHDPVMHHHPAVSPRSDTSPTVGPYFSQADASPCYPSYSTQMPPPLQTHFSFSAKPSPISPSYHHAPIHGQPEMAALHIPPTPAMDELQSPFGNAIVDYNNNPAIHPFDLGDLQFDNQYGAMEFSALARMSDAVANGPDNGAMPPPAHQAYGFANDAQLAYAQAPGPYVQPYQGHLGAEYVSMDPPAAGDYYSNNLNYYPQIAPQAYSIGNTSHTSPSADESASASAMGFDSPGSFQPSPAAPQGTLKSQEPKPPDTARAAPSTVLGKRSRDASHIYESVQEPYSYTAGFHGLTAFFQRRFTPNQTLRIAKALASIRPSFIACTKSLNRDDLIFMEKCFQRTLFEYDDLMLSCCTPTLVCRRTGEVAGLNQEFTMLTGWKKDVLLGYEPNFNINYGRSSDGKDSEGDDTDAAADPPTPRTRPAPPVDSSRRQPVFLAELLDAESVIDFYETFAKIAFGDARGSVQSRCKLLKYQSKEADAAPAARKGKKTAGSWAHRAKGIEGEQGITKLEKDGKIDCSYCWMVKRDVFDVPMLIVMNFLPCIGMAQDEEE